jgi:TPP-dependent pyruvate/acetoin dehydrogenase alpha subunit
MSFESEWDASAERLFKTQLLVRPTEKRIAAIYSPDFIKSPVNLSIGHEGVTVGFCDLLNRTRHRDNALSRTRWPISQRVVNLRQRIAGFVRQGYGMRARQSRLNESDCA